MRTSILLKRLESGQYELVEFLNRSDVHALVRTMRVLDGRTKRNHLHMRVVSADDTALETGVDSHDTRTITELFLVRLFHHFE